MVRERIDQYFEATLQLRNPTEEVLNMVHNAIDKRKNTWIAKEVKVKNGYDIYISSQRFTRVLGKRLKKAFKGKVVESRKLFSLNRQTSRLVYRGTVLFRMDVKEEKD